MATELTPTPSATSTPTAAAAAKPPAAAKRRRTHPSLSRKNLIGLGLMFLIGLVNLPGFLGAGGSDSNSSEESAPGAVLVLDSVCGLIAVGAVIAVWRTGRRGAVRLASGVTIVQALSAFPAFFVDVPAGIKALVSALVVITFASVVLALSPSRPGHAAG